MMTKDQLEGIEEVLPQGYASESLTSTDKLSFEELYEEDEQGNPVQKLKQETYDTFKAKEAKELEDVDKAALGLLMSQSLEEVILSIQAVRVDNLNSPSYLSEGTWKVTFINLYEGVRSRKGLLEKKGHRIPEVSIPLLRGYTPEQLTNLMHELLSLYALTIFES